MRAKLNSGVAKLSSCREENRETCMRRSGVRGGDEKSDSRRTK